MKMRRFLPLLIALSLSSITYATDYKYLTIENNEGGATSLSISNLSITFSNGNLVANDGTTIPLSSLTKMYFTETSGIAVHAVSTADTVTVYTTAGALVGQYSNPNEAQKSLPKGIYIIKDKEGNTYKSSIK